MLATASIAGLILERKISAGVFEPSRDGNAVTTATYALASDSLAAVAVTEEPLAGAIAPSGEVVLVGAVRNEE
jgi:hypothetical protein